MCLLTISHFLLFPTTKFDTGDLTWKHYSSTARVLNSENLHKAGYAYLTGKTDHKNFDCII